MADRITYEDKEQGSYSPFPNNQKWMFQDANEVKGAINNHADKIEEIEGNTSKFGFIDYNDTTGDVAITANEWTDVPNNGQGAFTNKLYRPEGVEEIIDVSTGYLDFSYLTLGSEIIVRNDFKITPQTNNSLLEVRYLLGQGAGEYPLQFLSKRLDNGSGIPYPETPIFAIYMGEENTRGGVGKLQVRLSTNGILNNAGSYISIKLR